MIMTEYQKYLKDKISLNVWNDRIYVNGISQNKIWITKNPEPYEPLQDYLNFNYQRKSYGTNDAYDFIYGSNANDFYTALEEKYPNITRMKFEEVYDKIKNKESWESRGIGGTSTSRT